MNSNKIGNWGEEKAASYLKRHGYKVLDRNCRYRQGEIDIVAEKKELIVFVEVKTRKNDNYAEAREFVTNAKQQRVIAAAQLWMQENDCEKQPRFDVIEIYAPNGESSHNVKINHLKNAF